MSGGLVPEKRIDVHGKVVTRHVRVEVFGKKSFSAPAPHLAGDRERLEHDALSTLSSPGSTVNPDAYASLFSTFSDSTLHMIVANVSDSGDSPVSTSEMVTVLTEPSICERDIREYITFAPGVHDEVDANLALNCIRGLKHSDGLADYPDLSVVEENTRSVCRTMLSLSIWAQEEEEDERYEEGTGVGAMHYDTESHMVLPCIQAQAPGLVEVIARFPDRGNDIINFIRDRGYRDADDLTDFLESGVHASLIAGVL